MLQPVDVGERALGSYEGVAPAETLASLRAVAAGLRGLRVLHLDATPYGGGVAELLRSGVPKTIHNGLQGAARTLTEDERAAYLHTSEINAALWTR